MLLLAGLILISQLAESSYEVVNARAYIFEAAKGTIPNKVIGTVDFTQTGSYVAMNGSVTGLKPGKHGFHVHEKGDLGNGCLATGSHYNPFKMTHGGPDDSNRHIGDLGNIETTESGETEILVSDSVASLTGPHSIIGRSLVIHQNVDDLGRGNSDLSKTTGDAGGRVACGIIGITEEVQVSTTIAPVNDLPTAYTLQNLTNKTTNSIFSSILLLLFDGIPSDELRMNFGDGPCYQTSGTMVEKEDGMGEYNREQNRNRWSKTLTELTPMNTRDVMAGRCHRPTMNVWVWHEIPFPILRQRSGRMESHLNCYPNISFVVTGTGRQLRAPVALVRHDTGEGEPR